MGVEMSTYHELQKQYTVKIVNESDNPPTHEYPEIPSLRPVRVSIIAGHTVELRTLTDRADIADRRHVELARELVALIADLETKINALTERLDTLDLMALR